MTPLAMSTELKATLTRPMLSGTGSKAIEVTYGDTDRLEISLRRTIRVPDNGVSYDLPPDCGPFPIYSVEHYRAGLPDSIVEKGGVFVPMYRKSPSPSLMIGLLSRRQLKRREFFLGYFCN